MKSSAKFSLTLLIFALSATGFFFDSIKALDFFSIKKNISFDKIISIKPLDVKDKQALVESGASSLGSFTFFDTLNDPAMKKYIGLSGNVISEKEKALQKPNVLTSKKDNSLDPQVISAIPRKIITPSTKNLYRQRQIESSEPGFVLQVGSFQDFNKAVILKNKLIKRDYTVYITSTLIEKKGYILNRVFVGKFLRKVEAEKVAVKIKESEKIEPLVRYFD
ncbi:MAG: SPOR domain-containing protein [Nitrospina sp.]|jgi:hypothetical protein|nr:SPOR domain-containing protein [Nitrospina sp.]